MSDNTTSRRRETFSGLWPWPGNIFLFLFAAWCFYMGSIATVADVKSAFFGLGAVSVVTLLLGLRAAFARGRGTVPTMPHRGRESRRSRAAAEAAAASAAPPAPPVPAATERGIPPRGGSNVRPMYPVEAGRGGADGDAVRELEAQLSRDRAERGAQGVKLDAALGALAARLERLERGLPSGEGGGGELAERVRTLETRATAERADRTELASLAARIGVLEKRASEGPDMTGYLKVQAFNNAITERLIPRVQGMIAAATGGGSGEGSASLAEEVAALKAQREADMRDLTAMKSMVGPRPDLPETINAGVRRRLLALENVPDRIGATEATLTELRDAVARLGESVARSDDGWKEVLRRIEGLSLKGNGPAEPETPADVAALREALTTIIEQNRDIKAEQARLSARLEPPSPAADPAR